MTTLSTEVFPSRRDDGTFSVAIRYAVLDAGSVDAVQGAAAAWVERKAAVDGLDLTQEFAQPPRVLVDASTLQVVLEFVSDAVVWKGLLVELVKELETISGISRVGIWDAVAGIAHPASLR